ncbi:MAG: ABC transporter ATP-binding protein [Candidatus Tectomicrobia bacterium]|nr:ABC transporter ATP-binding protein [Candidatus Tectomicrobia bacterium]
MLHVQHLEAFYGSSQALFGLSLEVNRGEVVTLLGRNGMGKTTTVHAIMGILPSRRGQITFEGQRIETYPSYRIARLGLGLAPEGRQVFPNLTVRENLVATAANRQGHADAWTADKILDLFPALASRRRSMGHLLSGGEQQMLAIGRALMTNPKLLILDEATEGLAPLIRRTIWDCLQRLKQAGQAILVIDKNVDDLTRIADRHYIIEKGAVVWSGDSATLRGQEGIRHRYLGV